MKQIKIRSAQDLKIAKEVYRYEAKISNQSITIGINRFRGNFKAVVENTLQEAAQRAIIFGIRKLTSKK